MEPRPRPSEETTVSCEVCLKRIPKSEAKSREGSEYTQYFCGLECYEKWRKKAAEAHEPKESGAPGKPGES